VSNIFRAVALTTFVGVVVAGVCTGGCSGEGGERDRASTSALTPPDGGWPADPDGLWQACGITSVYPVTLVYGDATGAVAGTASTDSSAALDGECEITVTINKNGGNAVSACTVLRHEYCHVVQLQDACAQCKAQDDGTDPGFMYDCLFYIGDVCVNQDEIECNAEGCALGSPDECQALGNYCSQIQLGGGPGPRWMQAHGVTCSASTRSCPCGGDGGIAPRQTGAALTCSGGDCPANESCTVTGTACGCAPTDDDGEGGGSSGGSSSSSSSSGSGSGSGSGDDGGAAEDAGDEGE
jgi:hypothetical protein